MNNRWGRNRNWKKLHSAELTAKEREKVYAGFVLSQATLENGVRFTLLKPGVAEGAEFGTDPMYGIKSKLRRNTNA